MATRTAPTVNGTSPYKRVSFRFIDASGDKNAVSFDVATATTNANIEALAVAYQVASQASLYAIEVTNSYLGAEDTSNATVGQRNSVFQKLVTLVKNVTGIPMSQSVPVPAPASVIMLANADEVDPASTELGDLYTALLAVLGSGWNVISARYSERSETNKAVKI
jgi:hypothetical protein